jgi:hypothetical protein
MTDNQHNNGTKKSKLTPEQLFEVYQECSLPNAPVKAILDRHGLKPWHLLSLRKRIKQAALSELSNPAKPGRKKSMIPVENLAQIDKELTQTKDALAAVGHELALLKKKTS